MPDGTGVSFAHVQCHFQLDLDEESPGAFPDGSIKVVSAAGQRKHEEETAGCTTCSTTKVVDSAGNVGPCSFLTTGGEARTGHADGWLASEGAPDGSRIVTTPSGHLTDEAWDCSSALLVEGVRATTVVADRPT